MMPGELFNLSGKTAIVTGGSGGLGRQIVFSLAKAGAEVVICSRNIESCKKVGDEVKSIGCKALALPLDVTNPSSVQKLVEQVINQYGSIDILVNASGITKHENASEIDAEAWNDVIQTNLTGVFLMCQAVGQYMLINEHGKIINISSVAGMRGYDPKEHNSIAYTSSKGAVHTLTKDLAVKWGKKGVYVNAIAPGTFLTSMNRERLKMVGKQLKENIPLQKFGETKDLAGAILYFASSASDHTTGQILAIDGGSTAK